MKNKPIVKISELVDNCEASLQTGPFGTQLKAGEYVQKGVPVINVRNIGYGNVRKEQLEFITEKKASDLKAHRLKHGDIVFGRKGAVDRHAYIDIGTEGWMQGSDCLRLRVCSKRVCNKFLSYYFKTSGHKYWMEAVCSFGATMSSLNQDIVKLISVPMPSLEAQEKIAAILSAYDDLIENNKRRIALLEKMAEEIYREWFVRMRFPGHEKVKFKKGVPKNWKYERLDDLCVVIKRGISPAYEDGSQRLVLNQRCIRDGNIDLNVARGHDTKVSRDKYIQYGDALINSTGVGTLGRISIVENEPDNITVDSHITICRANTSKVKIHYLSHSVKRLQGYFEYMATGATGQVELNRSLIASTKILVPKPNLQSRFSEIADPIWGKRDSLAKLNKILSDSRDMLLGRLISGKLSVDDLDIQFPPSMQSPKG